MENNLLKTAKEKYPKGVLFLSATGALKSPMKIHSLRMSENYKDTIYDTEGGIVYDGTTKTWAKIC